MLWPRTCAAIPRLHPCCARRPFPLPPAAANKQIKKQIAAIGRSRIRLREEPVQLRHIPACTKRNKSHRILLHLLQLLHLLAAALAIGRCALDLVSQLLHTLHREAYGSLAAMQCIGSQRIPQRTMSASDTTRPSADADARRSSASVAAASARAARSVRSASALACSSHVARADESSSCSTTCSVSCACRASDSWHSDRRVRLLFTCATVHLHKRWRTLLFAQLLLCRADLHEI